MSAQKPPLFGLGIYPEAQDPQQALRLAELADAAQLDFISMVDHPYRSTFLDPWTVFTMLGARTEHIRLLTNVICLPLRPPAVLAKAAATLDILTSGRFELGLGAGSFWDDIVAYGGSRLSPGQAFQALDEAIDVIRAIWQADASGKPVDFLGTYYQLHNALPGPAPAHQMGIWIGSVGPRMARLIGRKADGWVVSNIYRPFQEALPLQKMIDEAALEAGRDPAAITRWYNLWGVIETPGQPVIPPSRPGTPIMNVEQWVEQILHYYHDLRMDVFCFWNTETDREKQARKFIEEVIPAVRAQLL